MVKKMETMTPAQMNLASVSAHAARYPGKDEASRRFVAGVIRRAEFAVAAERRHK